MMILLRSGLQVDQFSFSEDKTAVMTLGSHELQGPGLSVGGYATGTY